MDVYNAACNPPRRAKRVRTPSPDHPDDPPKRRGRRPGTLSRAAREAQRKMNHSLIEKARRTKINDALATLRELVPPEYKQDEDEDEDRPKKPRSAGEKEFKLEILVRTVAYLQDLTDRVRLLEQDGCPRCREPIPIHPRLPSISAWLPDEPDTARAQLPTPPTSATCPPATHGFPVPPVLTLPSPSTLLPRFSGFSHPVHTPDDETAASLLLRISTTTSRPAAHAGHALTPSRLLGLSADR